MRVNTGVFHLALSYILLDKTPLAEFVNHSVTDFRYSVTGRQNVTSLCVRSSSEVQLMP